jgi:hypothetical protein
MCLLHDAKIEYRNIIQGSTQLYQHVMLEYSIELLFQGSTLIFITQNKYEHKQIWDKYITKQCCCCVKDTLHWR